MSFYDRVLPAKGPFTLMTGVYGPDGKLHDPTHWERLQTHEALEKKVRELATQPQEIYYAVGSYAGRRRKGSIAKRAFFLDLDFKSFDSPQDAIRGLNVFVNTVGLPPPSIYVSSGHGMHIYWCLNRDVPIAEWEPVADALKAKCAELKFRADPMVTADAARILRCPGTLNRKAKEPVPCEVRIDNGATYSLEAIAAPLDAASAPSNVSKLLALAPPDALITKPNFPKLSADEVTAMLASIKLQKDEREKWTHILCAMQDWGQKSEESWEIFSEWSATQPDHHPEKIRGEWEGFHVGGGITIGTLVKMAKDAGYEPPGVPQPVTIEQPTSLSEQMAAAAQPSAVDDDVLVPVVVTVVSDPLMIAAQHAVNLTGRVRFTEQDAINWLGAEFVTVDNAPEYYFSMTKRELLKDNIINKRITRYMPLNSQRKPIKATVIMEQWGVKQSVKAPGYHPTAATIYTEGGVNYVNRYTPPDVMLQANKFEIQMIELFWKHMFPRPQDQQFSKYMLQTYGHLVQHPDIKIESAPLIIGEPGSGKTTLAFAIVRRLVGTQNALLVDNETLKGTFNGHAGDKHVFYFDEIKVQGRWDSEDIANSLKNLVVGETMLIHPKFLTPFELPNRMFITATSNYDDAMHLSSDKERRWGVYEHFPPHSTAAMKKFFVAFHDWMKGPRGPGVLRWYFSQVDLTGYSPHDEPPWTDAKGTMVEQSQCREVQSIVAAMKNGEAPFAGALTTRLLVQNFLHSQTGKTYTTEEAGKHLSKSSPERVVEIKTMRIGGKATVVYCWKDTKYWADPKRTDDERRKAIG